MSCACCFFWNGEIQDQPLTPDQLAELVASIERKLMPIRHSVKEIK